MRAPIIFLLLLCLAIPYILANPQGGPSSTSVCAQESCTSSTGFDKAQCAAASTALSTCPCKPNYAGSDSSQCNICAVGYTEFPVCKRCSCNPAGSTGGQCDAASCTCKPGYTGNNCFTCDVGFWQFKTSNCKACDCDADGASGCDAATGQCKCKVGFAGDRCDRCDDGFFDYPACNGSLFAQNTESFIGIGAVLGVGALLYGLLRWRVPYADNIFAVILAIWLGKFAADVGFVVNKVKTSSGSAAVAFIFIPMVVNLLMALVMMAREAATNSHFQIWINQNTYLGMVLSVLSTTGVEILLLAQSRLFGWDALTAPFSDMRISTIQIASTVCVLLLDVPQLVYYIVTVTSSGRDKRDVFAVFGLFMTAIFVAYAALTRGYMLVATRKLQRHHPEAIAKSAIDNRYSRRLETLDDDYVHEKHGRTHFPISAVDTKSGRSSVATHIQLPASVMSPSTDAFMSDNEILAIYNSVDANTNSRQSIVPQLVMTSPTSSRVTSVAEPPAVYDALAPARKQRPISLVIVADEEGNVRPESVFGDVPPSPRPNMPPPRPPGMDASSSRATSIEINIIDDDDAS